MRAREPDRAGFVIRDGVRAYYEAFGDGEHALVFLTDILVTARMWKAQVGYLARHFTVVTVDPRGNGRSDKPTDEAAYADTEMVADVVAVLDELGIDRAVAVGLCESSYYALVLAATQPDRIEAVVAIGSSVLDGTPRPDRGTDVYDDLASCWYAPDTGQQGWEMLNRDIWLHDWPRWPQFFFAQIVNDPHSTKIVEDLTAWACESTGSAQVAAAERDDYTVNTPDEMAQVLAPLRCPVLFIHGTLDLCQSFARGAHLARMFGGELLALGGAGHVPTGRDPVAVNHAIADFVARVHDGSAVLRRDRPLRVRAHLNTRRDPAPPLPEGRRLGRGTAYGMGVPQAVALPAVGTTGDADAWAAQLPGIVRQLPLLALDPDLTGVSEVRSALDAAGVRDGVLFAPPGAGRVATALAVDRTRFAAAVLVDARRALAAQPGLLEFFVQRLPRDPCPASVVRALGDASAADAAGRAVLVRVVDSARAGADRADAVVTVEGGVGPDRRPARRRRKRPRVLYLSSPIGLGHVRRDLAIATALRRQVPDVQVDWLTQSPVTDFLERSGERVHPASAWLASESGHIDAEAGEHDLHAFQAIRRMDEILVNNFHVFDDLVSERGYDAWLGDEAWDLDHFLHENPRRKRAPFAWLTDFVGWVPMPDGGEHEAALTADYNTEMLEHIARYPGLRDLSLFVGDPDDVVAQDFGPGLPSIREWTRQHFRFCGYVMGERPSPADREGWRTRFGYAPGETVCIASVGGSGVGAPLLHRIVDAYEACRSRVPSLRLDLVTGPRIEPRSFTVPRGVTVHGFLPDLDQRHAACDIAIVQGGLSTTMELTAAGRPFLYFPLGHHFEQQVHVRHRLERHRAGRAMDYTTATAETIADALVAELASRVDYLPVPADGAERAARLVAEIL